MAKRAAVAFDELIERLLARDARALARAITLVENGGPEAAPLLKGLFPHTGRATVIGVTGSPGAGKSTLVDRLVRAYRQNNETVGVVAVDPSSPFTGGAILGDRIRMQAQHADAGTFIRSMATRGFLGGLARASADVITVLDAAGKQRILVETVGVGQDEVDIVKLADVTLVLLVPGMGDEVQTFKAGLMEIADVFVINKADRGAERLIQELRAMLQLAERADGWRPKIIPTVATEGTGIEELRAAIDGYIYFLRSRGGLEERRAAHWRTRIEQMLRERLYEKMLAPQLSHADIEQVARDITRRALDPYSAVDQILDRYIAARDTRRGAKPIK